MQETIDKKEVGFNTYLTPVIIYENGKAKNGHYVIQAKNKRQARIALIKHPKYLETIVDGATGFQLRIFKGKKIKIKKGEKIVKRYRSPQIELTNPNNHPYATTQGERAIF